jgi:type III pantothenate kinase
MYLIGDIGNTNIKICLFNSKLISVKKINFSTSSLNKKYLYNNLKFLKKYKNRIDTILFSSVVPKLFKLIKKILKKIITIRCLELKNCNLNKFVKIKVNRNQIGSDRLANAISAIDNKNNFIVVDFGTATNFDVIIKNQYIGGILAPGVQLSLNNLVDRASLIQNTKLEKIKNVIGKSTNTAIRSGFYHGYSGLIDNIIKLIIKQTGKSFKIILTGGLAHLFKNSIKRKAIIKKDLTINGILKVAIKS